VAAGSRAGEQQRIPRHEDAEDQALLAFLAAQREAVLSMVAGLDGARGALTGPLRFLRRRWRGIGAAVHNRDGCRPSHSLSVLAGARVSFSSAGAWSW